MYRFPQMDFADGPKISVILSTWTLLNAMAHGSQIYFKYTYLGLSVLDATNYMMFGYKKNTWFGSWDSLINKVQS